MKKTLIALAALAATGASFAQVTITGNLTAGYQQSVSNVYSGLAGAANVNAIITNGVIAQVAAAVPGQTTATVAAAYAANPNAGIGALVTGGIAAAGGLAAARTTVQNASSGFGVDTAEITFKAKEDLGGGQTIEATLGIENVTRGSVASLETPVSTGFSPSDATLTYTNTAFGRVQLGSKRGAALMSGTPTAGAPTISFDDKIFERRSTNDFVNFVTKLGPVVVGYEFAENSGGVGLGLGLSGVAEDAERSTFAQPVGTKQKNNTLFAAYNDSGLKLEGFYRGYDNIDGSGVLANYGGLSRSDALGFNVGYDFGVVNTGFGYTNLNASNGAKVTYMLAGVSMPLGALTLGATYGTSELSGVRDMDVNKFNVTENPSVIQKATFQEAEGRATGWSIGASYALSKRTALTANYAAWTRAGYSQIEAYFDTDPRNPSAIGYGPIETQANLLLSHSF